MEVCNQICVCCHKPREKWKRIIKGVPIVCLKCKRYLLWLKRHPQRKREQSNEYQRLWRLKNRDKRLSYEINRRAKLKWFGGTFTSEEWCKVKENQKFKCKHCGLCEPQIKLTIDHIIPCKKWLLWSIENKPTYKHNDIQNIQALCGSCNSKKSARLY